MSTATVADATPSTDVVVYDGLELAADISELVPENLADLTQGDLQKRIKASVRQTGKFELGFQQYAVKTGFLLRALQLRHEREKGQTKTKVTWAQWIEKNFDGSPATAKRYMRMSIEVQAALGEGSPVSFLPIPRPSTMSPKKVTAIASPAEPTEPEEPVTGDVVPEAFEDAVRDNLAGAKALQREHEAAGEPHPGLDAWIADAEAAAEPDDEDADLTDDERHAQRIAEGREDLRRLREDLFGAADHFHDKALDEAATRVSEALGLVDECYADLIQSIPAERLAELGLDADLVAA